MATEVASARVRLGTVITNVRILLNEKADRATQAGSVRTTDADILEFLKMTLWEMFSNSPQDFEGIRDDDQINPQPAGGSKKEIDQLIGELALPQGVADPDVNASSNTNYPTVPVHAKAVWRATNMTFSKLQLRDQDVARTQTAELAAVLAATARRP